MLKKRIASSIRTQQSIRSRNAALGHFIVDLATSKQTLGDLMTFELSELPSNPYSLGIVLKFLADYEPFSEFEFGVTTKSVFHQMKTNCHIVCVHNDRVAGYFGWVRTTEEKASAWLNDGAPLLADLDATAIVVTVFAVTDRRFILPMVR